MARYRKRIKYKTKPRGLNISKRTIIIIGCIFIIFGVIIGDYSTNTYTIPYYLWIGIGLLLELIIIFISLKENKK